MIWFTSLNAGVIEGVVWGMGYKKRLYVVSSYPTQLHSTHSTQLATLQLDDEQEGPGIGIGVC